MKIIDCDWEPGIYINPNDYNGTDFVKKFAFGKTSKATCFIKKFYNNYKFRYTLEYKLNDNNGKPIAIILMNPSFADEEHLDNTLYNVKNFLENLDYNKTFCKFIVLNIFPIRTPDSSNLLNKMRGFEKFQKKNDSKICKILEKIDNIIVAWGGDYHNIAQKKKWFKVLKKDNKNIYAYDLNDDGSPRHFSPYSYKYKLQNLKNSTLDKYKVKPNKNNYFEWLK